MHFDADIPPGVSTLASASHPERNEDNWYYNQDYQMGAVFDGMGGHAGGEQASTIARATLEQYAAEHAPIAPEWDEQALAYVRTRLMETKHETGLDQMGTTGVIARFIQDGISVAWSGDSRAWLLREGRLFCLTADHDMLWFARGDGQIDAQQEQTTRALLDTINTAAEAEQHGGLVARQAFERRNMLWSELANPDTEISTRRYPSQSGDLLLLTSDGVHDNLTAPEILYVLTHTEPTQLAQALVAASARRSQQDHARAKADDMTCVVVH